MDLDRGVFAASYRSNAASLSQENDASSSLRTKQRKLLMKQAKGEQQMLNVASTMAEQRAFSSVSARKVENSQNRLEDLAAENLRLRSELETFQNQNEDARDAMDRMLSDLIAAQNGLKEKETFIDGQKGVMDEQNRRLEQLQHNITKLSAELEGNKTTQITNIRQSTELEQTISWLRTDIREKEMQLREKDQILKEREMDWKVELHAMKGKLAQQRTQCENAVAELHEIQRTENRQDNGEVAAAAAQAEAEKVRAGQYLRELQQLKATHSETLSQTEAEKSRAEQYLHELQELKETHSETLSQLDIEKSKRKQYAQELQQMKVSTSGRETVTTTDNSQALGQLKTSHATELAELRRISDFFKNNSERLSKQLKGVMAENHTLKDSMRSKDRETQEMVSLTHALELQLSELSGNSRIGNF